jgi:hypothetical protein
MKIRTPFVLLLALLSGCATFKELEPVPPVQSGERGYIELRNDKENFLLKRDDKYFIRFPRPLDMHFYLVLQTNAKRQVHNYLTATFHDGEPPIVPIADETADQDSLSVFPVDSTNAEYFWVIDTVYQDLPLTLQYRYVPQWRYTVETKYDLFRSILANNSVDRRSYDSMGPQFDFSAFKASSEQQKLRQSNKQLTGMNDELLKLEQVFPVNIASSKDTMYLRYVGLRDDTKAELAFQSDYDAILTILQRESETKGDFAAFMDRASEFENILLQKDRFRAPILEYLKGVYVQRLAEALPHYDAQLQKRDDLSTIDIKPSFASVEKLYAACGQKMPDELRDVREFVKGFNALAQKVKNAENVYETAYSAMERKTPWPQDAYYTDFVSKLDDAKFESPQNTIGRFDRYKNLKITTLLNKGAGSVALRMDQLESQYRKASDVVRQINALRPQKDYRGIVHILRNIRDLDFVLAEYPDIDALLLKSQADKIREHLAAKDWKETEKGMADLQNDKDFLNLSQIAPKKLQTVQSIEDEMYESVKKLSFERVDAFAKTHETTIDNVPLLYQDSSFLPVYTLTFSSESPGKVIQRRRVIDAYLNNVKFIQFPENAVKLIYKDLTRAPHDRGVEKARAILAHAKFYKGKDKSVRNIIGECDPMIAKTLSKPKEYRRLLVLPVNESAASSNEYLFRVNVKIPTDAQFPVFDVNIKVPPEIAERAGDKQWFTEMTLNKKVVKTEGHMRVIAPTADNDYEAQITPVQMFKDKDNIIEIRFKYPSFQLFEVSVMAQVPLIRKN